MTKHEPHALEVDGGGHGQRLDRFLRRHFPSLKQSLVQKFTRQRKITVNRRRSEPAARLSEGDHVELWADLSAFRGVPEHVLDKAHRTRKSPGYRRQFRVLHEDASIVVLDKPGGLVVHPSSKHHRGDTLLDLLRLHLPESFARNSPYRPAFVHRLDRGTSGVIVAAKTREAAAGLEKELRQGGAEKVYLTLVGGQVRRREGTIQRRIERTLTSSGITRYTAQREGQTAQGEGKPAVTQYEVEQVFRKVTLLRVRPQTGRTHQIRVHLASIGHPVVGDGDYGDKQLNRHYGEQLGLRRLFLHAAELSIHHPDSGKPCVFRAPLPEELLRVVEGLVSPG